MSGIYIHIPFCTSKCFYCDFYSVTDLSVMDDYVTSLVKEISNDISRDISTIFIGGGTPSLLTDKHINSIFNALHKKHNILNDPEITLEANPGTLNTNFLKAIKDISINRLSIGVQSFIDNELRFLQRIHDSQTAVNSILKSREAGFTNISIDLIFSVPGQSIDSWAYSLKKANEFGIQHISAYNLTYEEGTPLFRKWKEGLIKIHSEETDSEMFAYTMEYLESKVFNHYEISNYAKKGFECKHNLNYWDGNAYRGYGTAAHSYNGKERYWNVKNIARYIDMINNDGKAIDDTEQLEPSDKLAEKIFLSIRCGKFDIQNIPNPIHKSLSKEIDTMEKNGYVNKSGSVIYLTKKGFSMADEIALRIISIADRNL